MTAHKPYAEMKDSGVEWLGNVPTHWSIQRLATLYRETSRQGDHSLPVLSISIHDGISDEELSSEDRERQVRHIEDRTKYKRVRPNDLAYNMMRAWQGAFGAVQVEGLVSPAYVVAEPTGEIQSAYMEHLLRTPMAIEEMWRYSRGITDFRLRLYWEEFRDIRVCVPPSSEQETILTALERETARIDKLMKRKARFIGLLAEKRQALITHAVTKGLNPKVKMKDSGVEWLGEVPEHWKVMMLRRVVANFEQGWSPDCESRPKEDEEWGVLKSGCVNGGVFQKDENKALPHHLEPKANLEVRHGDVLMSRASGSPSLIGSVAEVLHPPERILLSDKIFRLHLENNVVRSFFIRLMASGPLRTQIELAISGAEGLANNISQSSIKELWLPVPPLQEQQEISDYLDVNSKRVDTLITKTKRSIELLREHRTALINAAVTGKIDLRDNA